MPVSADPNDLLLKAAGTEGWTQHTMLAVCLDFLRIQPEAIRTAFARHIEERCVMDTVEADEETCDEEGAANGAMHASDAP